MKRVAIVKGTNPVETTVRALEMIRSDVDRVLSAKKPVLIKPNYINSQHPSTGITIDVLQIPFKPSKLQALTRLLKGGK
jgi:hypothetical protein